MTQTFIDLFCGAGGMSCGLEQAGWRCLLGIDFEPTAIDTFATNHPHAKAICGDLRQISIQQIRDAIASGWASPIAPHSKVNLICGGPPCQGFSTIGSNNEQDHRNFLFFEFVRVVGALKPDYLILENVTGLLSKKNEITLNLMLNSFQNLGYFIEVKVLSAHHYGVPEKRRRTIMLGNRFGNFNLYPKQAFKDSDYDLTAFPPPRTVGWALDNLLTINGKLFNHDIAKAQIANELERKRIRYIPEGKGIRYEKDQRIYLPPELWFNINWKALREERFRETKLQRLDRNCCATTINTNRRAYYHPIEDRYLTAREAAAIQSFPPNFIFQGSLRQQWRQIGNAVPPLLARALGEGILEFDHSQEQLQVNQQLQDIKIIRSMAFDYK